MKYLIHIILLASVAFAVDILSIQLPENVKSLSYNGYSIASKDNHDINPSSLSSCKDSYFEISSVSRSSFSFLGYSKEINFRDVLTFRVLPSRIFDILRVPKQNFDIC